MFRPYLAVCATLSAGAAACGVLFPMDEFTSGQGQSALPAKPDSASDAASVDKPFDAGVDATSHTFCEGRTPAPAFCMDFDESVNVADGWTSHLTSGGASAIDTEIFASSPKAVRLGLPGGSTDAGIGLENRLLFDSATQQEGRVSAHIEFKVWAENLDPTTMVEIFSVTFRQTNPYVITFFSTQTDSMFVEHSGPATDVFDWNLGETFPQRTWVEVELDVDFRPTKASFVVSFDGTPVNGTVLPSKAESGFDALTIGPSAAANASVTPVQLRYDDVLVVLK